MTVLTEHGLQITLPGNVVGRKFDDEATHCLSHCMKAVDFIIEMDDRILFIEFKDPEHPSAQAKDSAALIKRFLSGAIDADLKTKYRDSWLYEWGAGRTKKPIFYLVLIAASALSEAELLARTDALKRQLPLLGPEDRPWKHPMAAGCAVMNLAAWNRLLPPMPATRVAT